MSPFLPSSAARHIHLGKGVPVEALALTLGLDLHQLDAFDGSVLLIPGVLADAAEGLADGLKRGEVANGGATPGVMRLDPEGHGRSSGLQSSVRHAPMQQTPQRSAGALEGCCWGPQGGAAPVWSAGWYSTASTTVMALRLSEEP